MKHGMKGLVLALKRGELLTIGDTKILITNKGECTQITTVVIDAPKDLKITRSSFLDKK